ncbi:HPF/RaiA family ribosome-associated protein [Muriicola marianensis]|uniref:Ribosome-associated translation inhibitor RaiA n=1 Tax=Muriicola marianensis TaxID=1324801 RepID=A0ABQ1QUU1_9FLAO|nr:HPF/RaiA family ribosome-associated protein [Muriicola marianensis]GGD44048.1 hypothetical protein GCM10011361_08790 [Muriicola marianensis]
MKVQTQAVNFTADIKLLKFIRKRLDKLDVFYNRIVNADVYLKVENASDKENKLVEIKVHVPGDVFIVKKQCKTFEEAVDFACDSLERKLLARKRKARGFVPLKFL